MSLREVGIHLPPPVALARAVESLNEATVADPVFEPKWDGWRAVACGGRVWSRRGVELTRYLPDLAPILAARLPADAALDGELVAWDVGSGRLDFAGLQARLTAGTRIGAVAKRRPVQLVCFDLLAVGGNDLRDRPLAERRTRLVALLSGVGPPDLGGAAADQEVGDGSDESVGVRRFSTAAAREAARSPGSGPRSRSRRARNPAGRAARTRRPRARSPWRRAPGSRRPGRTR